MVSTQVDIITSGNPDVSVVKVTETTSLSPLNNHKLKSICSAQDSSQKQIKAEWSFRDQLVLSFLTVWEVGGGAETPLQI